MKDEFTGIKFIDNFIERKGFHWVVKLMGWVYIVSGILGIIGVLTLPFYKEQFLSKWSNYNALSWISHYGLYEYIIRGPIEIIAGILLLGIKEWGRKLVVLIAVYGIFKEALYFFIKLTAVLPKLSNKQVWMGNLLLGFIVYLALALFTIYLFTRPNVKEQFKQEG